MRLPKWLRQEEKTESLEAVTFSAPSREGHLDAYSETWIFVSNWAESELKRLRESNDAITLDAAQTSALRGRIKCLKELIALPDKRTRPKRAPLPDDEY